MSSRKLNTLLSEPLFRILVETWIILNFKEHNHVKMRHKSSFLAVVIFLDHSSFKTVNYLSLS